MSVRSTFFMIAALAAAFTSTMTAIAPGLSPSAVAAAGAAGAENFV